MSLNNTINNGKKPIIIKRMLVRGPIANKNKPKPFTSLRNINNKLIKLSTIPLYREDVIFKSNGESFLPGEYRSIVIINKLNNLSNNCTTLARCITYEDEIIEKTSENLTQLIGQEGYNTVFYSLCSVINQEYKIKAILSLLTVKVEPPPEPNKEPVEEVISTDGVRIAHMGTNNKFCQTDETRLDNKKRPRRRVRKVLVPYVMKPEDVPVKKVMIDPFAQFKQTKINNGIEKTSVNAVKTESVESEKEGITSTTTDSNQSLPDLGYLHDESNTSVKSYSTLHSINTIPDLLINPISIVNNVDKYTREVRTVLPKHTIMLENKTVIQVPYKPEDDFHIATTENLLHLNEGDRKKLVLYQMQIDYQRCLCRMDEDGNLPIHLAVINDDIELLKRQCVVLKIRNQSVDLPAKNGLTALKLSVFRDTPSSTGILLQAGADPCLTDVDHSTCVHHAAELRTDHLQVILHHCKENARNVISYHVDELHTPGWETKTDEELGDMLLHYICTLFDKQGHTPLMLSSKLGIYDNVRLLIESAPRTVSLAMPTSGNTALYLAVAAACTVATERGNKSKVVDHFKKTIEYLIEHGADPAIDNHNGVSVNLLLQEFNSSELSMLIASKVTSMKYFNGEEEFRNFDKYVLLKDGDTFSVHDINSRKKEYNNKKIVKPDNSIILNEDYKEVAVKKDKKNTTKEVKVTKKYINSINVKKDINNSKNTQKPVITENILIKAPIKVNGPKAMNGNVFTKDINGGLKIDTVSTVRKVIWYPPKKRKIENEQEDTKKAKNT